MAAGANEKAVGARALHRIVGDEEREVGVGIDDVTVEEAQRRESGDRSCENEKWGR